MSLRPWQPPSPGYSWRPTGSATGTTRPLPPGPSPDGAAGEPGTGERARLAGPAGAGGGDGGARTNQGAAADIAPPEYPAVADPFLTVALAEAATRLGIAHHGYAALKASGLGSSLTGTVPR